MNEHIDLQTGIQAT